jgi:predicted lipoprotein with Yx(FWY)xxD motif
MSRSLLLRSTVALVALASGAGVAGVAFAKSGAATIKSVHNSALGESILANSKGQTLYELGGETSHHLLCTSTACFHFWPPYKVSKNAKLTSAGVKGKLSKIHRSGFYQVTLNGIPLYRFSLDMHAGQATGQGVKSFGGTWHVVKTGAAKSSSTTTTTTTTTTMPPPTTSPYTYPTTSPY